MPADIDCRKDLHGILYISTSRVSLCWVKNRHPTGSLKWFFIVREKFIGQDNELIYLFP